MGPQELENAARQIVRRYGGALKAIVGDELLTQGFLIVHAVGRASCSPPRVIDFTWGNPHHPKITIVGKGVCFDSGGLNLKSHSSMLLMKKDMAGAAHALALADMIMSAKLPVRLRVMVPAVENSVSGNAMRPLDIVRARNGLSVEITNTDSEGRLILSDVLVEASSEKPEMIVDFASLTSAAGVALGPDLPAMFCNDDAIASMLQASATRTDDPLWRLPLWKEYSGDISSDNADLVNKPAVAWTFAASIYAALFLERFVDPSVKWVHIDTLGWNIKSRPGRPEGGEIRNVLALFNFFQTRFPIGRQ
jgi:leucyl aminopeptidase